MLFFSLIAYWLICLILLVTNALIALRASRSRLWFKTIHLTISSICALLVLWSYVGPGDSTPDSTSGDARIFIVLVLPVLVLVHFLYLTLDRWVHRRRERRQARTMALASAPNQTCESNKPEGAEFDAETANKKLAHLLPNPRSPT